MGSVKGQNIFFDFSGDGRLMIKENIECRITNVEVKNK